MEILIRLKKPHPKQRLFIKSKAKRKVIRAGRRGGKTTGMAILAVEYFLAGKRVLYAAPTEEQVDCFWAEVVMVFSEAIERKIFTKNETRHIIERPGTKQRIRAKTAWNADTLRGDYADLLILDEFQMMKSDAWELVGAPMLADNDGDAVFIFTEKRGKTHSRKLFNDAKRDKTGRWETFHFTSYDNPHVSRAALDEIAKDMTRIAFRREIMAEELEDVPGALWTAKCIEDNRKTQQEVPELVKILVGVDPEATSEEDSAETGIIVAGRGKDGHGYVLDDMTIRGTPNRWGRRAVEANETWRGGGIIAEKNNGGEMVKFVLNTVNPDVPVELVWASRGKLTRAEPISAKYEQNQVHHVGVFEQLEDQMCEYTGEGNSPDRMDALVWVLTKLLLGNIAPPAEETQDFDRNDYRRVSVWDR